MKKILFAAFTGMIVCCTSCTTKTDTAATGTSDQVQKNIAASDEVTKAFETGDLSMIDSVVSPDMVDHTDRGDMKGIDSLKSAIKFARANFKEMKMEKVHEVADNDYVYTWMRYTGTSDGSMGMPAGPYDMKAVEVVKLKDGKIIEHWNFMEAQDVMKMMTASMPKMDSTKMK